MASRQLVGRAARAVGTIAVGGMFLLIAACAETEEAPEETTPTTTTTTPPPVQPTENFPDFGPTLQPTGPNSFKPTYRAPRDPGF